MRVLSSSDIERKQWALLVQESKTGTWFQSPEAYNFFASMPELFAPFAYGVENEGSLRGVCCGYVTVEKNAVKQFLTRRAIIIGGPALADDCTSEEVQTLMEAVREQPILNPFLKERTSNRSSLQGRVGKRLLSPIYIETRNFNSYEQWKEAFEKAGFSYQPHLNFHVDTRQPWDTIEANIGKHRRKYIRLSFRDGATIEEHPTIKQVRAYYEILVDLYKTKVRMPLQPWSFFERLYNLESCRYLLVMYEGQVVGGSICMLLPGHGIYEWYACGKDGVFKNIHPSSVTKYAGMKYAADNGYAVFDMMGAGKPNEEYGVRDFKAEFGGELVEHGRYLCVTKPLLYRIGVMGLKILKLIG